MFAIIITEKGGTERREVFDKTEINVGRVQGNELMLPKGNVSKHHARLLYRDSRFIVTDLKSTNGTYVNGRKITQATIVREGDKIYIGDFILRVEVPPQAQAGVSMAEPMPPTSSERLPGGADHPAAPVQARGDGVVSHYPLENDPDEPSYDRGSPASPVRAPGPARMPPVAPPRDAHAPAASGTLSRPPPLPGTVTRSPVTPPSPPGPGAEASAPPQAQGALPSRRSPPAPAAKPAAPPRQATPLPFGSVDSIRIPAHRLGVFTLATRIEEMLDLGPIDDGSAPDAALGARIDRALREEAAKLRAANEISPEVDLEAMARDAHEELLGLGPLQALLQEEDLLEIHVQGYSSILSVRASGARRAEVPFASDASMRRVLRRLCAAHGGRPAGANESVVERALGTFDADLLVVLEPVARDGAIAMIRRRPQAALSLEDLVRSGAMSRAMATFLGQVVANRRNVLVAGPPGAGMRAIVAALACSGAPGDRVLVVQSGSSPLPMLQAACAILVPSDGPCEPVVRAACRLRPDHLVVPYFEGAVASEVVDAIAAGAEGVVAAARAPSLRHALGRLVAQIATVRAGVPTEAVRESLLASFEVLVEYTRLRDGRTRVLRISEPAGIEGKDVALRDVFSFAAERVASGGAIEGSFHPTGVVPKLVEELAARGVPVEQGLFRR